MILYPRSNIFMTLIASFCSKFNIKIKDVNIHYDLINFTEGHINIEYRLAGYDYKYNKEYNSRYSFKLMNREDTKSEDLIADTIQYLIINHGIRIESLGFYFEDTVFPMLTEYGLSRDKFDDNYLYKNYLQLKMIKELNK